MFTLGTQSAQTTQLAASGSSALWLVVIGVILVAVLLAAFAYGRRRAAARRTPSTPGPDPRHGPSQSQAQRGETWQTIDDDPDQGNPRP
ncbi:hypothetical protein GCM10010252_41140 [Streptomyces aureoverticillatus]|nr:hypothetical protein GCM10010252_41140 [Streptomyces aureoverticillatus]